ncbi:glycosyltransferase family 4 protein [Sediminicola sp. YIK13]|uniref:glycosyltransferase family 4 protein n=1 Tax=Sediminicola sp. YIK13 TaxID=1453352 RepID=UPI0007803433|nr:glycosyltransferase family 4 protein [Sediminicola sp. YIK13]
MKILYIHQYFTTPEQPGGTRSYWISKELIKHGHDVTMLTTTNKKSKKVNIDGIHVVYLKIPYSSHMGILHRLLAFIKFMLATTLFVLKSNKFDLILATSTPLTVGFPALVGKKIKKIPYFFEVRDLWPEVPIQMGAFKNKIIIKLTKWFERSIYRNAYHIVALSPGMYEGVISTGVGDEKVSMIPNMSKIDKFWPHKKNEQLIEEFKLDPNTFKVIYFGAMGIANGMNYILDAAKLLSNRKDIEFLFFGFGSMKPILEKRCVDEEISNIRFFKGEPMERLSEIVNFCDISLVTFSNLPILATNSPNKLFDSLSAGKPIIVNSPGWTKDMVEKYNCGVYVNPEIPIELSNQIINLKNNPELCDIMGVNSRKLAENTFDKSILCDQYAKLIASTL